MSVLIIGANGFLGSNLVYYLKNRGYNVTAIINQNREKLQAEIRVVKFEEILSLTSEKFDFIFYASGSFSSTHDDLIKINCFDLAFVSESFPDSKLIYISSTNVYGSDSVSKISESTCFSNPNIYGLSKIAGEFIVKRHSKYAIIRLCYLYGPNLNNNSFIPRLLQQAKFNKEIVLFGEGKREQDYLFIQDAVELCYLAANYSNNDVFLGASGQSYSNAFMANLVQRYSDETLVRYEGTEIGNSLYFEPSNTFSKLQWEPKISVEVGISKMWYESLNLW